MRPSDLAHYKASKGRHTLSSLSAGWIQGSSQWTAGSPGRATDSKVLELPNDFVKVLLPDRTIHFVLCIHQKEVNVYCVKPGRARGLLEQLALLILTNPYLIGLLQALKYLQGIGIHVLSELTGKSISMVLFFQILFIARG